MAIAIQTGHYSLSKSVKSVLRAHIDATLASISATVTDYLPEDLQGTGANVYLSDDRILTSIEKVSLERLIEGEGIYLVTASSIGLKLLPGCDRLLVAHPARPEA